MLMPIPARWSGDWNDQSDPARLGQLLRRWPRELLFPNDSTLGRIEGQAAFDASPEAPGLRLGEVEYALVV